MANTTWSTTDKTASLTLSGGNLTATASATLQGLRTADRQVTGKFYWEVLVTKYVTTTSGPNIAQSNQSLSSTNSTYGFKVDQTGTITLAATALPYLLGTRADGDRIGFALDLTNGLAWMRVTPSGDWNNMPSANPATSVGGIVFNHIFSAAMPAYPGAYLAGNTTAVTANFGDTGFSGAVPSGFTSGFTSAASIPTNLISSRVIVDQWVTVVPYNEARTVMML